MNLQMQIRWQITGCYDDGAYDDLWLVSFMNLFDVN